MIRGVVVRIGSEDLAFECDDLEFADGLLYLKKDSNIIMIFNAFEFLTIIRD